MAMALVKCPDCGKQVSELAPACPGCGRPMNAPGAIETERTAKQFKEMQLFAGAAFFLGLLILVFGGFNAGGATVMGALLVAGGMLFMIIAKTGAWWRNG
jgi:hypothetical protein